MLSYQQTINKTSKFSLKPDFIAQDITDIDFAYLKRLGITTCFIDLDGTVVDRGRFEVSSTFKAALKQSGMDIKIATNRPRSRSLKRLKEDLGATGVIHPHGLFGKPTKHYIRSALKEYGLKKEEVIMIGDRYIQDILGANRSAIYSLAVSRLGRSVGPIDQAFSYYEKRFYAKAKASYHKI